MLDSEKLLSTQGSEIAEASDPKLRERILTFLLTMVGTTASSPDLRRRWKAEYDLRYEEEPWGIAPVVMICKEGQRYHVYCRLPRHDASHPKAYAEARTFFSETEMAPFLQKLDATGLSTYLQNDKLIREATKLLQFDEALEQFKFPITDT